MVHFLKRLESVVEDNGDGVIQEGFSENEEEEHVVDAHLLVRAIDEALEVLPSSIYLSHIIWSVRCWQLPPEIWLILQLDLPLILRSQTAAIELGLTRPECRCFRETPSGQLWQTQTE